jgi:energy-converting hydrogenase Eha subunit E
VRTAFYLPWLEILCGLALITRRLYAGALAILLGLMLVFIGATISAKVRGIDITCGCFGAASQYLSFAGHLALDAIILVGLVLLWRKGTASTVG